MNVRQDSTLRDCDILQQLLDFVVMENSKSDVSGLDTFCFVLFRCIASKFHNLSSQILQNSSAVDSGTLGKKRETSSKIQLRLFYNISLTSLNSISKISFFKGLLDSNTVENKSSTLMHLTTSSVPSLSDFLWSFS